MQRYVALLLCLALATSAHASTGRHLSQVTQPTGPTATTTAPGGAATVLPTVGGGPGATTPVVPAGVAAAVPAPVAEAVAPTGPAAALPTAPPSIERFAAAPAGEEARTVPNWLTLWAIVQQQANLNLGSMNALLQQSGLFRQLDDPSVQLTVFAPTDEAFMRTLASVPNTDLQGLLNNINAVTPVLEGHVVNGKLTSRDLTDGMMLNTLNPNRVLVVIKNATGEYVRPSVAGGEAAQIIFADTLGSNGYLHAIDRVLLWPEDKAAIANLAPSAEGMPPIASFVQGGFAPVSEVGTGVKPTAPVVAPVQPVAPIATTTVPAGGAVAPTTAGGTTTTTTGPGAAAGGGAGATATGAPQGGMP